MNVRSRESERGVSKMRGFFLVSFRGCGEQKGLWGFNGPLNELLGVLTIP